MGWALVVPPAMLVLPLVRSSPALLFLPMPWIAAWLGAGVVRPEEGSAGEFFLHHLPVARWRWLLPRALLGLAIGLLLGVLSTLLALLCHLLGWAGPSWNHESILPLIAPTFLQLYILAYLLAVVLAPWLRQRVLTAVLALVTLAQLVALGLPSLTRPLVNGLVITAITVIAWWSLARSSAFEPGSGKTRRTLWVVASAWGALSLLTLIRP